MVGQAKGYVGVLGKERGHGSGKRRTTEVAASKGLFQIAAVMEKGKIRSFGYGNSRQHQCQALGKTFVISRSSAGNIARHCLHGFLNFNVFFFICFPWGPLASVFCAYFG